MEQNDELKHYGVLGMRWGVRRATKKLQSARSSGNKEGERSAIASLNKHRGKITKKLEGLNKEGATLAKKGFKVATKMDPKIAKLETKIAKYQRKANGIFTSEEKAMNLTAKANNLNLKVSKLKARSNTIKADIAKNKALTDTFSKTLSDIDNVLVDKGKKFLKIKNPAKNKHINQKTYDKFYADDVEGVVKNMSEKQRKDVYEHVSKNADWPEIEDYIARKYNK